ncbi:MAG: hypothetical protein AB7F88_11030 [Pyrinomonadaceae bacterium]
MVDIWNSDIPGRVTGNGMLELPIFKAFAAKTARLWKVAVQALSL